MVSYLSGKGILYNFSIKNRLYYLLCILSSFCVLPSPKAGWKYFFWYFQTFFLVSNLFTQKSAKSGWKHSDFWRSGVNSQELADTQINFLSGVYGGGGTNGECYDGNILYCMKRHERKPRIYQWRLLKIHNNYS